MLKVHVRTLTKKQRSRVVERALGTADPDNEPLLRRVKERMDKCGPPCIFITYRICFERKLCKWDAFSL